VPTSAPAKITASSIPEHQWINNPPLSDPIGYPGFIQKVDGGETLGENSEIQWAISVQPNQLAIVAGSYAVFPNPELGELGVKTGCYLVIARGLIKWSTSPSIGDFAPIRIPKNSANGWEVDEASSKVNISVWASQKAHDLAQSSQICGRNADYSNNRYPGIDIWILP
jgi:hypothetical protein